MYPYKWAPDSKDENIKSGTAIYMIDGKEYRFHLESFSMGQELVRVLDIAYAQGRQFGAATIKDTVISAATRRASDFGA